MNEGSEKGDDSITGDVRDTVVTNTNNNGGYTSSPPIATALPAAAGPKVLQVDDLDGYLYSLLVGPLVRQLCQQALQALQPLMVPNNSNHNTRNAMVNRFYAIMETISNSSSWQTLIVQSLTLLIHQGTSPGARALGLVVVEKQESSNEQRESNHRRRLMRAARVFMFVFLQAILPKLYQQFKENQQQLHHQQTCAYGDEHDAASVAAQEMPEDDDHREKLLQSPVMTTSRITYKYLEEQRLKLSHQRRRQVWKKVFQATDTIIPIIRLGLLLRCWSTISSLPTTMSATIASPNLAMNLCGLEYAVTIPTTAVPPASAKHQQEQAQTRNNTAITFFVLYAHRRWVHQELMSLWAAMGVPLIYTVSETYQMIRQYFIGYLPSSLLATNDHWRRIWRYRPQQQPKNSPLLSESNAFDNHCRGPCIICRMEPITLPYQIENCGHVACYSCLWEYLCQEVQRRQQATSKTSMDTNTKQTTLLVSCPLCFNAIQSCKPI